MRRFSTSRGSAVGQDETDPLPAERVAAIEQLIYEAAIVPERWPKALDLIREIGEGAGAVLFSVTEWDSQWTSSPDFRPVMQEFVEKGWAARNSRMANGLRKGMHLEPRFVTEADFFDPHEMESDLLHTEFFWPRGLGQSAGTIAHLPHGDMLCFSVEKELRLGPVSAQARARLDSLRPHLVRAAVLTARLGLERVRTAVETLAHLGFAAAGVTRHGRVLVANAAFGELDAPWTTRGGDRIALRDRVADRILIEALEAIGGTGGVRSIPLRNADLSVRQVLHVVPVRGSAHDIFTRSHAILVVTAAVDRSGSPALLQVLFDLTAAEAAVARGIAAGRSLEEMALEAGRSVATLRNQLKNVFAKTGCTRQADLARLLVQLVPPAL